MHQALSVLWSGALRGFTVLSLILLIGCGARTGLELGDERHAGGPDAGPPHGAETCDGTDQDHDGVIDEGLPPLTCTTGTCTEARPSCVDGRPATCPVLEPTDEVCNDLDDDCDGRVDEGLGFGPVGDPIVVRDVDDGTTGDPDCQHCRRVIRAQLATIGGRLRAIWNLDFGGFITVPNTFVRTLDDDGHPVEPSRPLLEVPTTKLDVAPSHSGRSIAGFCQRHEDIHDYARSVFFDGDARVVSDIMLRAPADEIL